MLSRSDKVTLWVLAGMCLVLGFICRDIYREANASRNSSGTYSLPAGNPVVSGTIISSTVQNNTTSDIATELTNSLDRNGRGAMLAPLQLASGTLSVPSLTWSSEQTSGWYRIAANDYGYSQSGTKILELNSTGLTVLGPFGGQGAMLINSTGSGSTAIVTVGGPDAAGGNFSGGTGSGGTGIVASGGSGSATNYGGLFNGGAGNAAGIDAIGGGTAVGGLFANGTAPLAGAPTSAIGLIGQIGWSTTPNTTSTVALSNVLNPEQVVKGLAQISINSSGTCSVTGGWNVTACGRSGDDVLVTWASSFTNSGGDLDCLARGLFNGTSAHITQWETISAGATATVCELRGYTAAGAQVTLSSPGAGGALFTVWAFGKQ